MGEDAALKNEGDAGARAVVIIVSNVDDDDAAAGNDGGNAGHFIRFLKLWGDFGRAVAQTRPLSS